MKWHTTLPNLEYFKRVLNIKIQIIKNKKYKFENPDDFQKNFDKPKAEKKILITIDDAFSEIPASNIKLERRMEWLKSMMNMDIAMLPEDVKEWRSRIIKKLKNIKSNSIIFSHFMVINVVVGYIKNHPILLSMYPDNGSLTKIKVSNGKISLIKIGDEKNTKINT